MGKILCTLNYETKDPADSAAYLQAFSDKLGKPLIGLRQEQYWKIKKHMQAHFEISLRERKPASIIYTMLKTAHILCYIPYCLWIINGPYEEEGHLHFELILDNKKDPHPVKWIHLQYEEDADK